MVADRIYDDTGRFGGFIQDGGIYEASGAFLGALDGESVFSKNGRYVGEHFHDMIVDKGRSKGYRAASVRGGRSYGDRAARSTTWRDTFDDLYR
jgi:hypothetical protein